MEPGEIIREARERRGWSLAELAAQVDRRVRWYYTPVARQRGTQSWIEHRALIAAIADRDERRATDVMRAHTEHTRRSYLEQRDDADTSPTAALKGRVH